MSSDTDEGEGGSDPLEPTEGEGSTTSRNREVERGSEGGPEGGSDPSDGGYSEPSSDGDDGDERPEIEDDERADLDLSGIDLEAVDDEGDDQDDQDASEEAPAAPTGSPALGGDDPGDDGHVDWGDLYVDLLALFLVSIVDEYGDGDSDLEAADIEHLANQPPVVLSDTANRVFEDMTGMEDLPPGQALVIGTAGLGAAVLMKETDVMDDAVGELAGQLGGGR